MCGCLCTNIAAILPKYPLLLHEAGETRALRRAAQTVDRLSAPQGSLESVFPTRNLQCIPQSVRGRQPPVLISFTRVTCEMVDNNVRRARRGMQHRLPLRVTFERCALKATVCSRGLIVLFSLSVPYAGEALLKPSHLVACAFLSSR
jgi:hypothetical protein